MRQQLFSSAEMELDIVWTTNSCLLPEHVGPQVQEPFHWHLWLFHDNLAYDNFQLVGSQAYKWCQKSH
jgi:hypothetical protein